MEFKKDHQPSRIALIIFIFLVVFCTAQLTWWIVFHIDSGTREFNAQLHYYESQNRMLSHYVTATIESRLVELRHYLPVKPDGTAHLDSLLERLREEKIIAGYWLKTDSASDYNKHGTIDSALYATVSPQLCIFIDSHYPQAMAAKYGIESEYVLSGAYDINGSLNPADMFSVPDSLVARFDRERRRTVYMLISEGSVFFLVILFGAFMIYRTLRRSEELKYQQQNFIHSVTHELKAPLASIRLYLETIESGKITADKVKELFPKMLSDCDRLEMLIDNVLEAGHFGKTGYQIKLTEANLSEDIIDYLDAIETLTSRFGGHLVRHIEHELYANTDYQALRRAVHALIDNAMKYSPAERREIRVSLTGDEASCYIRIRDFGPGITSREQKRVFERFYRGNEEVSRQTKGTGLGLFLVKEIVEAHGGQVIAGKPDDGPGTVFTIRLPRVKR